MIDVDGETETKYYYHFDGLGSVRALSNIDADVVERYSYDAFGEPNRVSDVNNPYMFTGRRYDSETNNYYYRFRYYDPEIGKFFSTDPLYYYDSMNLYQYVLNNAVNMVDPMGMNSWKEGDRWGHQDYCVGDPQGSYFAYGFYPSDPDFWNGKVKRCTKNGPPGKRGWRSKMTPGTCEEDKAKKDMMDQIRDLYNSLPQSEKDWYIYGLYDCHSFAEQMSDCFGSSCSPQPQPRQPQPLPGLPGIYY